jgi:hypothetical protein
MELLLARHLWGVDLSHGLSTKVADWKAKGYQALETAIPEEPLTDEFYRIIRQEGWNWIACVYTDGFRTGGSVGEHLDSLRRQIEACVEERPLLINAHSGVDRWSTAEMEDFFDGAMELERRFGIPLCHETHRRRCLATPWAAEHLLAKFPELKLTADLSHWVCVCERLLEDFDELITQVARQTWHVHARVGFEQGPQVPDPRAPEWAAPLRAHEGWWQRIWAAQVARGAERSSFTPEFGPPPYLWAWPYSREPAADLPEVCDWMASHLRAVLPKT